MSRTVASIIKSITPNLLLIFSIAVMMYLIPREREGLIDPIKAINIIRHPCDLSGNVFNENEQNFKNDMMARVTSDKKCNLELEEDDWTGAFFYIVNSLFTISCSATDYAINKLSRFIHFCPTKSPCNIYFGTFAFYICIYLIIVGIKQGIVQIPNMSRPSKSKKSKKSKKKSFIFDIIGSIFYTLAIVYTICLLVTIGFYVICILGLMASKSNRPMLVLSLLIFVLTASSLLTPILVNTLYEGLSNKQKRRNKAAKVAAQKRQTASNTASNKAATQRVVASNTASNKAAAKINKINNYIIYLNKILSLMTLLFLTIPVGASIFTIIKSFIYSISYLISNPFDSNKFKSVSGFGIILFTVIIFLQIFTPYANTIFNIFTK